MSSTTANLGLYKPDLSDTVNTTIPQLSSNFDKIDSSLAANMQDLQSRALNVKYPFGTNLTPAKGDGTTDDTAAIQSAINSLPNGGSVYIPSGTYIINNMLTILNNNVNIIGNGLDTILSFHGSGACITLGHSDYSNTIESVKLKNFWIDGGNSPSGQDNFGIVGYRALYCEIDVKLSWFDKTVNSKGIKLDGGYSANSNYFCATNTIYPRIGQCSQGIFLDNCVQNTMIIGGVVDGNPNNPANYAYGININDIHSQGNLIIGTDIEDCNTGIRLNGTQNQLIRPRVENCSTPVLQDTGGGQNTIIAEWGVDSLSNVINNGGQLKLIANSVDQLSQLVEVVSPASTTAAEMRVIGGSGSNGAMTLYRGATKVAEISNVPNGNDVRFFALETNGTLVEVMGMRTDAYIPKAYLKGSLTFDNGNNSGDVANGSIFKDSADGKLKYKDNNGVVNLLY